MNLLPFFSFLFENTENMPLIDGEWCTQCVLPREVAQLSTSGGGCRSVDPDGDTDGILTLNSRNDMISTYTPEECAGEWMQNNAEFRWLCHEWFRRVWYHSMLLVNSPYSFDVETVSQSHSVLTSAENAALENSPQSIRRTRLCNGHVVDLKLCQTGFKKWRGIKFWCVNLMESQNWNRAA